MFHELPEGKQGLTGWRMGQDNAKNTEKWQDVATNPLQYYIYIYVYHTCNSLCNHIYIQRYASIFGHSYLSICLSIYLSIHVNTYNEVNPSVINLPFPDAFYQPRGQCLGPQGAPLGAPWGWHHHQMCWDAVARMMKKAAKGRNWHAKKAPSALSWGRLVAWIPMGMIYCKYDLLSYLKTSEKPSWLWLLSHSWRHILSVSRWTQLFFRDTGDRRSVTNPPLITGYL